ncbi:MAG: type II toxin-antitoxin system HicB family antitoxin [Synergistaceae bacterium]|jgi:predicted RNase H-like HicB family nuclease|nr:type II toxin-antitoxin system HicB family antitoxin [Synergistaceae bacterium]
MEEDEMRQYNLSLIYYPQDGGGYHVKCPEIQGCFSYGDTLDEAESRIMDLISDLLPNEIIKGKEDEILFREGLCMRGKMYKEIEVGASETGEVRFASAKAASVA